MHISICKKKNIVKRFYLHKARHFSKSKTICVTFLYTKSLTLFARFFYENVEIGILYTKPWHFALRDVFMYKKPGTFQKARQFALLFYIQKAWHFGSHDFLWFFLIGGGGGTFFIQKAWHFELRFICKSLTLCVTFLNTKSLTFCVTF